MRVIDVQTLNEEKAAGKVPVLVDVRNPDEYASGHIPGTVNIPLPQFAQRADELSEYKDGAVYMVCQRGGRSAKAGQHLESLGYDGVVNVDGGTAGWAAAGFDLET